MKFYGKRTRSATLMLLPTLILALFVFACGETVTETVIQTVVVEKRSSSRRK